MRRRRALSILTASCAVAAVLLALGPETAAAQDASTAQSYAAPAGIDSRLVVWVAAQLHLMFAAFVLAVPMFALCIEYVGWRLVKCEPEAAARYDWLAH